MEASGLSHLERRILEIVEHHGGAGRNEICLGTSRYRRDERDLAIEKLRMAGLISRTSTGIGAVTGARGRPKGRDLFTLTHTGRSIMGEGEGCHAPD